MIEGASTHAVEIYTFTNSQYWNSFQTEASTLVGNLYRTTAKNLCLVSRGIIQIASNLCLVSRAGFADLVSRAGFADLVSLAVSLSVSGCCSRIIDSKKVARAVCGPKESMIKPQKGAIMRSLAPAVCPSPKLAPIATRSPPGSSRRRRPVKW